MFAAFIAALISALGFVATPAVVAAGVAIAKGVLVIGALASAKRQERKARRAAADRVQDQKLPVRSSDEPRRVIYGTVRVSGPLIYHKEFGTKREKVTHVIPLATHEVDEITDVWFNDASIGALTTNGATTGGQYYQSRILTGTDQWTGGGASSTHQLALTPAEAQAGETGTLVRAPDNSIDLLVYRTPIITTGTGAQADYAYLSGGDTVTLVNGVHYTVSSGGLVTMLTAAASGLEVTATYRVQMGHPLAWVKRFRGIAAGERDNYVAAGYPDLETDSGGEWTSTMVGKGVARIHVTTLWDPTAYATGFPNVSAVVKGKRIYDARLDSTNGGTGAHRFADSSTWAYSSNPALQIADLLCTPPHLGGFGCGFSEIDWASVRQAAADCDVTVPTSGQDNQKRYESHIAISLGSGDTRQESLEMLADSMAGTVVWSGGVWTITAGVAPSSVITLDESDLAGEEITIQARSQRRDLFNSVRGRISDPTKLYAVTDYPPYQSSTYIAEDGGETIYRDIDLPAVNDSKRAQRLAKLALYRHRQALFVEATFKLSAYKIKAGDAISLTIARYGWSAKLFRVTHRTLENLNVVKLRLQEEAAAVYDWSYSELNDPDPAPNTDLPKPSAVPAPTGVLCYSDGTTFTVSTNGGIIPFVRLTWALPASDELSTRVSWKRAGDTAYRVINVRARETTAIIEPVSGGEILCIYLQHVNALGATSTEYPILPYYVVSALLPKIGEQVPPSANLVPNSTFENGAQRWSFEGIWGGGATGTGRIDPPSYHNAVFTIPGPVRNAVCTVSSTYTGNDAAAVWQSESFAVTPGETMVAFAELHCIGTNAAAGVAFYTTTGAYVGELFGTLVDKDLDGNAAEWAIPGYYTTSRVRGVVPAGAQVARFTVWATTGWWSNLQKYVSVLRPFAGTVDPASTLYPVWTPSGSPVVDSPGIQIHAATEVFTLTSSTLQFGAGGSLGSFGHRLTGPTFTTTYGGTLEISLSFKYVVTAPSTNAILIGGVFDHITNGTGTYTSKTPYSDLFVVPANTTDVKSFSLTDTLQVAANSTIRVDLMLSRSVIETPTASGIVSKTTGGSVNSLDRIESSLWRCTLIKR
jgi:hypothetical protein